MTDEELKAHLLDQLLAENKMSKVKMPTPEELEEKKDAQ